MVLHSGTIDTPSWTSPWTEYYTRHLRIVRIIIRALYLNVVPLSHPFSLLGNNCVFWAGVPTARVLGSGLKCEASDRIPGTSHQLNKNRVHHYSSVSRL